MSNTKQNRSRTSMRGKQGRKDSKSKRINDDNERLSKWEKDAHCKEGNPNDVSWYANNAELLRSAASLPFSYTTGLALPFKSRTDYSVNVPGVMTLYWTPAIGGYLNEAIQSAKESIYSYVVHANSRNTSYNATDQMMVILAGANIFAGLAMGIRAYGTMKLFDQRNMYLPDALVMGQGFSPTDLRANLSHMWFDINEMIARAQQIWIPNDLPFIARWFWLNSNIYMDGSSVKGQYYQFAMDHLYAYEETISPQGGCLGVVNTKGTAGISMQTAPLPYGQFQPSSDGYWTNGTLTKIGGRGTLLTWNSYMTMMNYMFNHLLQSEDRGLIMGDILKAYGKERLFAITPITSDYTVTPVYNTEVLTQIENADIWHQTTLGFSQVNAGGDIRQEFDRPELLNQKPMMSPRSQGVLNFHQTEVPTPEQIMVATRLKAMGTQATFTAAAGTGNKAFSVVAPAYMGTEYVSSVGVMTASKTATTPYAYGYHDYPANMDLTSSSIPTYNVIYETSFDWCPWMYDITPISKAADTTTNFTDTIVHNAFGDWDNFTIIDAETLNKMHTTAVYSEFGVPTLG